MTERKCLRAAAAVALVAATMGCDRDRTPNASQPGGAAPAANTADRTTGGGSPPGNAAGIPATVEDTTVTAKVKAALLATDGIQATDISVETRQGVVILTGKVADASQARRAVEIAQSIEGVRTVDNRLSVSAS
jgi:hyperosmotically inducible periplasmic protein